MAATVIDGGGVAGVETGRARTASSRLWAAASLECAPGTPAGAEALAAHLPPGTRIYVPHLPGRELTASREWAIALRARGFVPIVHVAARRLASAAATRAALSALVEAAGVKEILLIGGDVPSAAGPYADAKSLLASGIVADAGIRGVEFGAYPEGHPAIGRADLERALDAKIELSRRLGLTPRIVTQFCFDANAIATCAADLSRRYPGVPVRLGFAGPARLLSLLKFARLCGVGASLRAMGRLGFDALRLAGNADPSGLLDDIAWRCGANVEGAHFFSFGGSRVTAAWLAARKDNIQQGVES